VAHNFSSDDFLVEDCGEESSDPVQDAVVLGLGLLGGGWGGRRLHLRLELHWLSFRGYDRQRRSLVYGRWRRMFFAFENEWRVNLDVNFTRLRRRQGASFGSVRELRQVRIRGRAGVRRRRGWSRLGPH
jgi:hypothetical protein